MKMQFTFWKIVIYKWKELYQIYHVSLYESETPYTTVSASDPWNEKYNNFKLVLAKKLGQSDRQIYVLTGSKETDTDWQADRTEDK